MSSRPTTMPSLSSTGKCRKRLSTIISNASSAESSICTHLGFFVITSRTFVDAGSTASDSTRRVMSLSAQHTTHKRHNTLHNHIKIHS